MLSIKVAYKGKNIALPRGTNSLLKIEDELKNRYPGEFPNGVTFKYENIDVESFEQLHTFASSNGGKSLKISAEPTNIARSSQIKTESEEKKIDLEEPSIENRYSAIPESEENAFDFKNQCETTLQFAKEEVNEEDKTCEKIMVQAESADENNNYKNNQPDDFVETICIELEEPEIPENKIEEVEIPNKNEEIEEHDFPVFEKPFETRKFEENEGLKEEEQKVENYPSYISNEGMKEDDVEELREIEPGVYECVFCKELQLCNVCDTKRKIGENSKFIKIINKIVEKKIDEKLENRLQKIEEQIKEWYQMKEGEKSSLKKSLPIIEEKEQAEVRSKSVLRQENKKLIESVEEITDNFERNKKNVEVGEEFFWTFNIKLRNPFINYPQQVQILDNKNLSTVKSFEINKRETIVEVGPFKIEKEGKMEKTFRLSLNDGDEIILFGHKFGFNVEAMKQRSSKSLSNSFRNEVEIIKKAYKIERSTEYLIERLKEIGITEENLEESKEILPDILQTV